MLNLSVTVLSEVVDQSRTAAAEHPRWLHAIDRAVIELLDNPYIARGELHGIVVMSSTSANLYSANGTCQCEAYKFGQPCWHRAAARLVRLHDEKLTPPQRAEPVGIFAAGAASSYAEACRLMDELYG